MRPSTRVQRSMRSSSQTIMTTPPFTVALPAELRYRSTTRAAPSLPTSQVCTTPLVNVTVHCPTGRRGPRSFLGNGAGARADAVRPTARARRANRSRSVTIGLSSPREPAQYLVVREVLWDPFLIRRVEPQPALARLDRGPLAPLIVVVGVPADLLLEQLVPAPLLVQLIRGESDD